MRLEQIRLQLIVKYPAELATVREGLKGHAHSLQQLHTRLTERPISKFTSEPDLNVFVMMISTCCATARVACVIAQSLMTYVQSRKSQITSMRATPIYLFNDEQRSWPMIEWREKDNMWTLAIFHFENVNQPEDGSWLMHSGIPYVTKQCWRRSRIDWNVANVNHLKILFGLAQHALGLMEWPVEDAISLCNHISSQNCSINEYGLINGLLI